MSWESLPSTHVLSPAQRRDTGLSTLSETETNMQRDGLTATSACRMSDRCVAVLRFRFTCVMLPFISDQWS